MKLNIQLFASSKSTSVTESNLDATNNTSTLKIKITFSANNNVTYFSNKTLNCTCDGVTQSAKVSLSTGGSVTKTFTFNDIDHGSSGSRDVSWKWNCNTGTNVLGNISDSGTKTLTQLHTPPILNSITIVETNPTLISAGISNDLFVLGLSQKQYTINATYYDSATYDHTTIINKYGTQTQNNAFDFASLPTQYINVLTTTNNILDLSTTELKTYKNITTTPTTEKVLLKYKVYDSLGASVETGYNYNYYDYTTYSQLTLTASVKRDGQTTGRVVLNASGSFHKGTIGNVTQTAPTIKYKYWELGTTEPATYSNTITSGVTITDNTFTISNLNIGNNYDYQKAYRIKVQLSDNFTSIESNELSISVGEATWTEYKDRVDFKNITIRNTINVYDDLFYSAGDTFEVTNIFTAGYMTNSSKDVYVTIYTPKRLDYVTSITINTCTMICRTVGGTYLNGASGGFSYGASGYTWSVVRVSDNNSGVSNAITFHIIKSSAFSSATNNSPLGINLRDLKLTFS